MKNKLKKLQQKFPSDDPLTSLFTWTTETRRKVTEALKPYIRILSHDGSLQWIAEPEDDALMDSIELLARAAAFEMVGVDKQYHLRNEQAQDLANEIIGAGKDAP